MNVLYMYIKKYINFHSKFITSTKFYYCYKKDKEKIWKNIIRILLAINKNNNTIL